MYFPFLHCAKRMPAYTDPDTLADPVTPSEPDTPAEADPPTPAETEALRFTNWPGESRSGLSIPLADAMACQFPPSPALAVRLWSDTPEGAWASGCVPGVVPPGPPVLWGVGRSSFCDDMLSEMLERSGLPSLEKNSSDSSIDSTTP